MMKDWFQGYEEKHPVDRACEEICPNLTMQQRVIGYCAVFGIGTLLNIFSWAAMVLITLAVGQG